MEKITEIKEKDGMREGITMGSSTFQSLNIGGDYYIVLQSWLFRFARAKETSISSLEADEFTARFDCFPRLGAIHGHMDYVCFVKLLETFNLSRR